MLNTPGATPWHDIGGIIETHDIIKIVVALVRSGEPGGTAR